jgi:hypothetical protein
MPTKTKKKAAFKLTYATMFNPPEELHTRYDKELARIKASLGQEYGMIIDGKEVKAADKIDLPQVVAYPLARSRPAAAQGR